AGRPKTACRIFGAVAIMTLMPSRKPNELHKICGTYREDRHGKGVPVKAQAPEPPAWLDPEAKAEWKRLASELVALGLLALVDRGLFTLFCETWGRYVAIVKKARGMTPEPAIALGLAKARDGAA